MMWWSKKKKETGTSNEQLLEKISGLENMLLVILKESFDYTNSQNLTIKQNIGSLAQLLVKLEEHVSIKEKLVLSSLEENIKKINNLNETFQKNYFELLTKEKLQTVCLEESFKDLKIQIINKLDSTTQTTQDSFITLEDKLKLFKQQMLSELLKLSHIQQGLTHFETSLKEQIGQLKIKGSPERSNIEDIEDIDYSIISLKLIKLLLKNSIPQVVNTSLFSFLPISFQILNTRVKETKGRGNNRCFENSIQLNKEKGYPIWWGYILPKKLFIDLLEKDKTKSNIKITFEPIPHVWNVSGDSLVDSTLGSNIAKDYWYVGCPCDNCELSKELWDKFLLTLV